MEKYNHAKSYHAFAALALSFTILKATELKVNLPEERWFSMRLKVIDFKDIKLTKDQEDLVDQLSQGMSDDHKESVIRGVRKVKPDQLNLFIDTLKKLLSQNIYVNDKEDVIKWREKFNPCFSLQEIMRFSKDSLTKVVKLLHFYKDEDDEEHIASIIQYLGAMNPDHYTDTFVNTVNQLCQEMNTDDKLELIKTMGKIPSDRYTNAFINTVNQLCQGINADGKLKIIKTMGKIPPDRYTDAFINTVDQLCLGINADGELKTILKKTEELVVNVFFVGNIESYKNIIIEKIGNIPPDRYTDYFISTVNYLKNGMNELDKIEIIEAVGRLCPDQYLNLINTFKELSRGMNHNDKIKIINALINIDLDQYATNFINVVHQLSLKMDSSHKLRIIEMLSEIHYDTVLGLLKVELETLKKDPLKSSAINQKVYNWTIQNNKDQQDKDAIAAVVTYLDQKDSMREKLATWLYAFMDESKKAYDSLKSHSCVQGVKERVITSLRSAIPEGDSALQNLFYQAEIPLIIAAKSKKLTDYEFWARKLQANGIKSTTTQADAKVKFNDALNEYFEGINDAHVSAEIEATLDAFEDSQSDCDDGLWSKIKAQLLRFEK